MSTDELTLHMVKELYRVVADPSNPDRLEAAIPRHSERIRVLETKFNIVGTLLMLGGTLAGLWNRIRGS